MFDLSNEFDKFYKKKVVLSAYSQNDLRKKKNINIERLKDGLKEYNQENGTDYKICESRTQGSMAMYTVVQNDKKDYDIDVAIVFEKDNLEGLGALATRRMVADALKRKTKQFDVEPEIKTSCVRIKYKEGYHIDFAIYMRYKENEFDNEYKYEHAGDEWSERGIRSLEDWFENEIKDKDRGNKLRNIVRFSKMFCKSRESWKNMPSGLIQTILCAEQLADDSRIDKLFYNTMKKIIDCIDEESGVNAPVDNDRPLVTREIDRTRIINWKNSLSDQLKKLDVLFDDDCTYPDAADAWYSFFKHDYWKRLSNKNVNEAKSMFDDTEQFIEDMYFVDEQYDVEIDCKVIGNGFRLMNIDKFIDEFSNEFGGWIPHNFTVKCSIGSTTAPSYDMVLWKVRNVGKEAEKRDDIRGQILERGHSIIENTVFKGNHYIECYLIKNDVCIAIGYVEIPIGDL